MTVARVTEPDPSHLAALPGFSDEEVQYKEAGRISRAQEREVRAHIRTPIPWLVLLASFALALLPRSWVLALAILAIGALRRVRMVRLEWRAWGVPWNR